MKRYLVCPRLISWMMIPLGRFFWRMGRLWFLIRSAWSPVPALPLLIVGSLRMGGAGKTPLVAEIAKDYHQRGFRVAVMAYSVHAAVDLVHIVEGVSWKMSSEESVWLAQHTPPEVAVYATRNRWKAWCTLAQMGDYDVVISDDGNEDRRLKTPYRIVLDWGERGWSQLFPHGPLRSLVKDHPPGSVFPVSDLWSASSETPKNSRGDPLCGEVVLVSGIGDPERFEKDVRGLAEVQVLQHHILRDHSPRISQVMAELLKAGQQVLLTEKDAIKLEKAQRKHPKVFCLTQKIEISQKLRQMLRVFAS